MKKYNGECECGIEKQIEISWAENRAIRKRGGNMSFLIGDTIHDVAHGCEIKLNFTPNAVLECSEDDKITIKRIKNNGKEMQRLPAVEVVCFSEHQENLNTRWDNCLKKLVSQFKDYYVLIYSDGNVFPPQDNGDDKSDYEWQKFKLLGICGRVWKKVKKI